MATGIEQWAATPHWRKTGRGCTDIYFGKDAIAEGIGEILTPIELPAQQFLLLKPDAHISTAELFVHPLLKRDCASLLMTI